MYCFKLVQEQLGGIDIDCQMCVGVDYLLYVIVVVVVYVEDSLVSEIGQVWQNVFLFLVGLLFGIDIDVVQ